MTSLTKRAGQSALWQISGGAGQTIIRLGASVVLARMLTPQDFGIYGMALLFKAFVERLGNLGMGAGIIARKETTEDDLCTCFWTMAGLRVCLFILMFATAPLASNFFNNPDLTTVVRVISLTFLFSIPSIVANFLLSKELRYQAINVVRSAGVFFESGLAVTLVLTTNLDYWALVFAMLSTVLLTETTIGFLAKWYPKFRFSKLSFNYLFYFGINQMGTGLINYLQSNIDYLVVGRILGASKLGLYEFAYRIPHLFQVRLAQPAASVLFPAMSKVQEEDKKIFAGYLKATKYIAIVVLPALFGLSALAFPTVKILWGDQWLPIVFPLQILCFSSAIRCINLPTQSIFLSKKRPDLPFKLGIARFTVTLFVVLALGKLYGLNGIAYGMFISATLSFINLYFAFRLLNIGSFTDWILNIKAPIIATLFCYLSALVLYNLLNFHIITTYTFSIILGMIIYIITYFILFKSEIKDIRRTIYDITGIDIKII